MNTQTKIRLAIFASGTGTNAEAIMKYFLDDPDIQVVMLLSNNPEAGALERAKRFQVPTRVFNRQQFRDSDDVVKWLKEASVTHIVLAGFLWLVPPNILANFPHRIINIHPALLPKYGGKGMYGGKVHSAVKAAGDTESGITIHEVNEHFDEGRILFQAVCPVSPSDTAEDIAENIHVLEHENYPVVIKEWTLGELKVKD